MSGMEITETLVVIAAGRAEYAAPNADISRYHQVNCLGDRSKLAPGCKRGTRSVAVEMIYPKFVVI